MSAGARYSVAYGFGARLVLDAICNEFGAREALDVMFNKFESMSDIIFITAKLVFLWC